MLQVVSGRAVCHYMWYKCKTTQHYENKMMDALDRTSSVLNIAA